MMKGGHLWTEVIALTADFVETHKLTATRDRKNIRATLHNVVWGKMLHRIM